MKLLLITALFGFAAAQQYGKQANYEAQARIIALDSDVKETGFRYNYETENGIKGQEQGQESDGIEAQGAFSYTGDDGQVYSVSYSAGQGGFQPQGAHFPVAPPVPEEILKALEQNARDEAAGIIDDGSYNPAKYGDAAPAQGFQQQTYKAQASAGFRQQNYNKRF